MQAGILVNFTCGGELSLLEVEAALSHLQAQTGGKAEIVLGVVNDPRLQDRVEAILVITGLGSPTLEETLSKVDGKKMHSGSSSTPAHPIEVNAPEYPTENEWGRNYPSHPMTWISLRSCGVVEELRLRPWDNLYGSEFERIFELYKNRFLFISYLCYEFSQAISI